MIVNLLGIGLHACISGLNYIPSGIGRPRGHGKPETQGAW
jgi:hypothetical protein